MAEWDVVSTTPAPKTGGADPWAVVSHVPAAPPGYEDNPETGYHYRPNTLADNPITRSPIWGAADIAASGVSKLAGKIGGGIAGLGTSAANALGLTNTAPADVVGAVKNAVGTEATSPGAADVRHTLDVATTPIRAVTDPVGGFLDRQVNKLPDGGRTAVQGAEEAIPDILSVLPVGRALSEASAGTKAARAANGGVDVATQGGAKPVVGSGANAVETGRAAGFKFTPGAVQSRQPGAAIAGDIPDTWTVTPNDRRAINLHNQAQGTVKAGEVLGLKNATDLPKQAFDEAKQPHFDTYKETGDILGNGPPEASASNITDDGKLRVQSATPPTPRGLTGSPEFISNLEGQLADTSPTQLKGPVVQQTNRILAAAKSGNMTGPQMVKDMSWLRANKGKSVAKAIEGEMDTQLAATPDGAQQLDKFRDARTGLAQINTLQEATKGGQLDMPELARLDQKYPNLLTGNLKLIAQTAAAAPQDFRLPSGVVPGSSPISKPTWAGAAKGVAGYAAKKVLPEKFNVQSNAFQNRFGREASPTEASYLPSLGARPTFGPRFSLDAPAGSVGVRPVQRGMTLPAGPAANQELQLTHPDGEVGIQPQQLGMQLAQGRPAAPGIALAPPEGQLGEPPSRQLGMELAQGRPLADQKLQLQPSQGTLEPHQPSLLGHEGTPEGGSRESPKAKAKKRGKD